MKSEVNIPHHLRPYSSKEKRQKAQKYTFNIEDMLQMPRKGNNGSRGSKWETLMLEGSYLLLLQHTFVSCTIIVYIGASLVVQWLRIRLPMQGTQVRALVWEDPTCHGATKPVHHNYWVCALEPVSHNYWACVPQLLKPSCLEPVLRNKRSHHNEKPVHCNEE